MITNHITICPSTFTLYGLSKSTGTSVKQNTLPPLRPYFVPDDTAASSWIERREGQGGRTSAAADEAEPVLFGALKFVVQTGRTGMVSIQSRAWGAAAGVAVLLCCLQCSAAASSLGSLAARLELRSCLRSPGARIRASMPLRMRGGDSGESDAQYDGLPRESKVYIAKMAEQAERFEEMVSATKSIAKMGVDLTVEERSLLSVAYKNVVGSRRASWKIISSIEQKETEEQNLGLIRDYLVKVEKELSDVCREIISLLGTYLIPSATEAEPKVFYLKMHGDYWRYLAEVANGDERKVCVLLSCISVCFAWHRSSSTRRKARIYSP